MPTIQITTIINAPVERVFDLARSIDAHMESTSKTKEKAIDGVTSGLISMGQEVTWQATHFGIKQRLRVRITQYDRPASFADEMVFGAFKSMRHVHRFEATSDGMQTLMTDELEFQAPFGVLGKLAHCLFLTRYMKRFLVERNAVLKELAESDRWDSFISS